MNHLLKVIIFSILVLIICTVSFYFWASRSRVDRDSYNNLKTYAEASEPKDTLNVLTYNLGYLSGMTNNLPEKRTVEFFDNNLNRSKNLINASMVDIIGFQEIDFGSSRSFYRNQIDSLGFSLEFHQAFNSVNWDKRYVPFPYWPVSLHFGRMNSGQAIVSRYPIIQTKTIKLEPIRNAPFYYDDFYLNRLAQMADVRIGDIKVKVINVHLEAFDTETREIQAKVVQGIFEKYSQDMPVLLVGDFNSEPPWEENSDMVVETILSSKNISSAVTKEVYQLDEESFYTFSSKNPSKMIDYIFYNDNFITKIDSKVLQTAGDISDHLPVLMKFTFKSKNRTKVTE